jgi:predicted nicotinamide N-methyase
MQFEDPDGDAERQGICEAHWPLFGLLWPSALHLAARIARRNVTAERILELGCGLALPSLVAHRRGADVTASDHHPLTPGFLLENLRLNALPPMKYVHHDWQPVSPIRPVAFDLVMASDVLYESDPNGRLAECIADRTVADGEVWIVDPNRGHRPRFSRHMRELGFAVHESRLATPANATQAAYAGRMLSYRRGRPA